MESGTSVAHEEMLPETKLLYELAVLTWDKWFMDSHITKQLNEVSFAGVPFMEILKRAMRLVFYDEHGNRGLLYRGEGRGSLHPAAVATVQWNGGRMNGFSDEDLGRTLSQGQFPHYQDYWNGHEMVHVRMVFQAPQPPIGVGAYAYANRPGLSIFYNAMTHEQIANQLNFPKDASGVDRLVWISGAIVLHEVTHNQGFSHPRTVDYNAGSDYASTLPFVAERAVLMNSPYWPEFNRYFQNGLWLTGPGVPVCPTT